MIQKYRFSLLAVFVAMLATPVLRAQSNCYVRLEDASGYQPAAEQIESLGQAAAELCAVFDSAGFGGQFKVYDFGFYLHHETTDGGYSEPFARKVQEVAALSSYYLLFGKQSDRSGVYTRFWVEARLPDSLSFRFPCLDTIGAEILRTSLGLTANIEYEALEKMPHNYHLAEIRVMNKLKAEVDKLRECCYNQQRGLSSCDAPCFSSDEIRLFLEKNNFDYVPITIIDSVASKGINLNKVTGLIEDYSDLSFDFYDGYHFEDLGGVLYSALESMDNFVVKKGVVTDNNSICLNDYIQYIENLNNGQHNFYIWFHIWESPNSKIEDRLYFRLSTNNLDGININLPFIGYLPIEESFENQIDQPNTSGIIKDIYFKNNIIIPTIHWNDKSNLTFIDLYNEIRNRGTGNVGHSKVLHPILLSDRENFVRYNYFSGYIEDESKKEKGTYRFAYAIAHEFLHQVNSKCFQYIILSSDFPPFEYHEAYNNFGNINDPGGIGHVLEKRNLVFPGDGLNVKKEWLTKNDKKLLEEHYPYNITYTDLFFLANDHLPLNNGELNDWERIASSHKRLMVHFNTLYRIEYNYGRNSDKFKLLSTTFKSTVIKKDLTKYDWVDRQ